MDFLIVEEAKESTTKANSTAKEPSIFWVNAYVEIFSTEENAQSFKCKKCQLSAWCHWGGCVVEIMPGLFSKLYSPWRILTLLGVKLVTDGHHYTGNSYIGSVYWLTEVMLHLSSSSISIGEKKCPKPSSLPNKKHIDVLQRDVSHIS